MNDDQEKPPLGSLTPAKLDEGNPSGANPSPELPYAEDILDEARPPPEAPSGLLGRIINRITKGPEEVQKASEEQMKHPAPLPYAEDLLPWKPMTPIMSGEGWDEYVRQAPLGRVLNAFGQGAAQGWGTGNLGFSPESEEALKKYGIFNDVTKGQHSIIRALNEGVMRPTAAIADALMARGPSSIFGGLQASSEAIGGELGVPNLGRELAAIPEAFFGSPGELAFGIPHARPTVPEINAYHVGESDSVYFGTTAPATETPGATADMIKHQREAAANANEVGAVPSIYAEGALGPTPGVTGSFTVEDPNNPGVPLGSGTFGGVTPPRDVNEAALRIAPEAVSDYENLSTQRDALRANIDQAQTALRENAAAQAPHAAEIADLERRLPDATPRLAKKYEARLAEIVPQRDEWLAGDQYAMLTRDTDEISRMRDEMERLDYRRRDLAPEVNAAYRKAEEQFQEPEAPQAQSLVAEPGVTGRPAPVAPEQRAPSTSFAAERENLVGADGVITDPARYHALVQADLSSSVGPATETALRWAEENGRRDLAEAIRDRMAVMAESTGSSSLAEMATRYRDMANTTLDRMSEASVEAPPVAHGAVFVSPNVAEDLKFPDAVAGLTTERQARFTAAAQDVDDGLGLRSSASPAVGAWADGAENSTLTEYDGASWEQLLVAAAMKAHIGEQKAALVFLDDPQGAEVLSSFRATGSLADIHRHLLEDGVEFHTVVPMDDGAIVYVADLDGSAIDAIKRAADRYGTKPSAQSGRAKLIGTDKQDGTGAEQRADAQAVYDRIIQESGVPGAAALWERLRDAYGQAPSRLTAATEAPEAPRVVPNIAADVSQKLVAAGRPQDEADASGAFVEAYYNTRAERLEGAKGTGAELYAAEGPEIRAGRGVVAAARREALERELAQKGREYNQVTIPDEPIGVDQRERNLSVVDILDPSYPALKARSRGVEEIAQDLQDRGSAALKALGVRSGRIEGPDPLTDELLARTIAGEIKDALRRSGRNASDWYTRKIAQAMGAISTVHPELALDRRSNDPDAFEGANARSVFTAALAITSQGETVPSNVRLAEQVYAYFKEHQRFPEKVVGVATAKNGPAMNANFAKLNVLIDAGGLGAMREFLSKDFTVKDLTNAGHKISGENMDTRVKGSVILGPKIGQGFYQNLNGNFDPVTMDLWFMRAWGRLTGTLVGMSPEARIKQRARLEAALEAEGQKVPKTIPALLRAANKVIAEHERDYSKNRAAYDAGEKVKAELTYAAERFQKGQNGINETPGSGGDRIWMRSVVGRARELLAEEGINFTPADLQATWWYPEKDLYGKLGGRDSEGINVDYASAISDLARNRGVSDDTLARAMGSVDERSGPAGGADVGGGAEGVREEGDGATTYYQKAKRKIIRGKVKIIEGGRDVITLLKTANASTFIHEVGHVWLEDLLNDALDERAPQQLRDDAATVRKWLGAAPEGALTDAQHERFARGFERYWMLGVAPSRALDRVFAQFRSWLSKIYQTAEELRAPITDDIRDVFDRMLTTKPERATIAPEPEFEAAKGREVPAEGGVDLKAGVSISSDVAALAEGDAEQTAPRDAEAAADQIRDERDNTEARFGNASGGTAAEAPGGAAGRGAASGPVPAAESGPGAGGGVPEPETVGAGGNEAAPEGPTAPGGARGAEPTFSAQPYPGPEPTYLDKAANVRLELLTEDMKAREALKELAALEGDYWDARRGVISDAQVLELADSINATAQDLNIAKLRQMSVEDDIPMAARIKAGRKMVLQAEQAVRVAAAARDAEAFIQAGFRLNMIMETVTGVTAEWGRAGRAFRDMREETEGARDVAAIVREASGRELFQIESMMRKVNRLPSPGQVAKYSRDAVKPGLFDWGQAVFINALLSGPFTHAGYTVAGELYAVFRTVAEGGIAAAIGETRHALGVGPEDYTHAYEVARESYGIYRGAVNGGKAAWDAFKANEPRLPKSSDAKPISMSGIIPNPGGVPIGTILESPSRLVTALHTYNYTTFYSASISQQAAHIALEEARAGKLLQNVDLAKVFDIEMEKSPEVLTARQALANRIAYLEINPTDGMVAQADKDASQGALMQRPKPGSPTDLVSRLVNLGVKVPDIPLPGGRSIPMGTLRPAKFIDPFVVISSNVLKASLGRGTPLALFKQEVRDDLMMRNGGAAFDRTAGKILAGSAFMVAAGSLAARGLLNPSGPSDPREAAEWRRIHGMPHGLRVGNMTFDMLRMGVLGMQMSIAADMWHAIDAMSTEDGNKVASELVHAFSQNILDESFMRGPSEALRAVEDSDRYGPVWVRNFVSSAMPFSVGLSQIAREIDPDTRQARTTMDAIKAKIPFVSESLYPRYDVWGHEVANRGWAGTYHSPVIGDATDAKLYSLHIYPSQAKREIMGVPLTDAQYAEYAMIRGRIAKQMVDALVGTRGFSMQPELAQTTGIRDVMEAATRIAEQKVRMHSLGTAHDIARQAIENKRAQLKPPPTVH